MINKDWGFIHFWYNPIIEGDFKNKFKEHMDSFDIPKSAKMDVTIRRQSFNGGNELCTGSWSITSK